MDTKRYKTKTKILERKNIRSTGTWEIAIDTGYSGVKLFSPNKIALFPYYARNIGNRIDWATGVPDDAILYRAEGSDDIWLVGEEAYNLLSDGDTSDSETSLYGRDRYYSAMFRIISECGIGIALMPNSLGKYDTQDDIVIQTGLPEKYLGDSGILIDSLAGMHRFSVKIGDGSWMDYDLDIKKENIHVMSQPKGSLLSVCLENSGRMTKNARDILNSSVLVFDPGFGTLDFFELNNGCVKGGETIDSLGMKRVFKEAIKMISEKYGKEISIPALQKYLTDGSINVYDRKALTSKNHDISGILEQASIKVCNEAIDKLAERDLSAYRYLIITGGTGAAWADIIKERLKRLSTLKLCFANINDSSISIVFSNVRGYYMNRYAILEKEKALRLEKSA